MSKQNIEVTEFLDKQNHPLRKEIELLRNTILNAKNGITENIKWNGPNYCFENEDRITMRIQPHAQLQLVFHRGAKVLDKPGAKILKNDFGLIVWKGNDRAVATFKNQEEIENNKINLTKIIIDWINATKKG